MSVSLAILILYIAALFAISWYAKKRSEGEAENYALAGRKLNTPLIARNHYRPCRWRRFNYRRFGARLPRWPFRRVVHYCLGAWRHCNGHIHGKKIPRTEHYHHFGAY